MITRRTLLAGALAGGTAAALSGCGTPTHPAPGTPSPPLAPSVPSSAPPTPPGGPFTLRLMSWNVMTEGLGPDWYGSSMPRRDHRWATRAPRVRQWLRATDADVVCFQEALGTVDDQGQPSNLMVGMLPGRGWANIDHFLPIMFRASLLELRDAGITEIYPGSTTSPWPRYCSWARLRHRSTGRDLMVFNTHQAPFQTTAIARIRSATVSRLIRAMRAADPGYRTPAVLAGDFNARADERRPIYSDHLRKLGADGWRDSARIARRDLSAVRGVSTHNGFGVKVGGTWRYRQISTSGKDVNYLWVRPGATVIDRETYTGPGIRRLKLPDGRTYPFFADGPVPSDHCPVLARVRFA
ncbi:MAG: endonuclease/exonuclease/phosphatase family protein [Micropruina sp.]